MKKKLERLSTVAWRGLFSVFIFLGGRFVVPRLVKHLDVLNDLAKMRHILRIRKTRKHVTSRSVGAIRRDDANNPHAIGIGRVKHRTTADPVNGHTVNQVCALILPPCADIAGEEARRKSLDSRKSKPTNFDTDRENLVGWEQWYKALWKIKLTRRKEDDSRVRAPSNAYDPLTLLEQRRLVGVKAVDTNRLLPLLRMPNNVRSRGHAEDAPVMIGKAKEACPMSIRGLHLDEVRCDLLNDISPVHMCEIFSENADPIHGEKNA